MLLSRVVAGQEPTPPVRSPIEMFCCGAKVAIDDVWTVRGDGTLISKPLLEEIRLGCSRRVHPYRNSYKFMEASICALLRDSGFWIWNEQRLDGMGVAITLWL